MDRHVAQTLQKTMQDNGLDIMNRNGACIMSTVTTYQPLGTGSPEETYFYMMNCLLYSRMDSGFPSNDKYLDEDVNVYLASLLTGAIHRGDENSSTLYLASCDSSLFDSVRTLENPRAKYNIYKTNADRLIIALGIFGNPRLRRHNSTPHMAAAERSYIGRGKAYYSLAESYAVETCRRHTAIADVLGKLSRGFEKYVKILSLMRSEYFDFRHRISEGELFHLEKSLDGIGQKEQLKELYDEFLDLYSAYGENRTDAAKRRIEEVCSRIREIDPSFRFEIE